MADIPRPLKGRGALDIAVKIVRLDFELGVVAPVIGITDLDAEPGDLVEGLGLGRIGHPGDVLDAGLHRRQEVMDQVDHLGFGFGREIAGDIGTAQRFAERTVGRVDGTLPQRPFLGDAVHGLGAEVEVAVVEAVGQVGRGAIDRLEGFPGLERLKRGRRIDLGDLGEGGVFGDDDLLGLADAGGLEEGAPFEARREGGQRRQRHRIIGLGVIALFDARPRDLGDLGFESDDGVGVLDRIGIARHAQHIGDVDLIGLQLVGIGGRQVIVAVGQAEARLAQLQGIVAGLLGVVIDRKAVDRRTETR